ncbi:MAG TPA: hypothetical protein VGC35_09520 [Allosphingosinicella sp.]|jgi:hypothetical protein
MPILGIQRKAERVEFLKSICALIALLAAQPAASAAPEAKAEAPGYLLVSAGTRGGGSPGVLVLFFKSSPSAPGEARKTVKGVIDGRWGLLWGKPHFAGEDKGKVLLRELPPGQYGIYRVNVGNLTREYPKKARPTFNVHSGETTYIGNIVWRSGEGLHVADQSERDVALVKSRGRSLAPIRLELVSQSLID